MRPLRIRRPDMKKGMFLIIFIVLLFPALCLAETYWGDLHVHTYYSGDAARWGLSSTETPEKACQYAKNNGLNFVAVTDHSENGTFSGWMDSEKWTYTVDKLKNNTYCAETSTFIPFVGYEWTNTTHGHKSVIFKNLDIPWSAVFNAESYALPTSLWTALDNGGYQSTAVTLPHHPAGGPKPTNWDYHVTNYQPIVEIYSEHGNSEYYGNWRAINPSYSTSTVDYALGTKRYKMGVIAGTDAHDAQAGSVADGDSVADHPYNGGLIAVIAPSLTRESIWYAIKNRRTYATTGPKITLAFSINGSGMGTVTAVSSGEKPTLHVYASGWGANISKLEIIKNGDGGAPKVTVNYNQLSVTYDWTDNNYTSGDFYYVRVTQTDNERAWSSPIWVVTQ
jgi:hypothetical protein